MAEYIVRWTMVYQASGPEDALKQALGGLDTVINHPGEGPEVFEIEDNGRRMFLMASEVLGTPDGASGPR